MITTFDLFKEIVLCVEIVVTGCKAFCIQDIDYHLVDLFFCLVLRKNICQKQQNGQEKVTL